MIRRIVDLLFNDALQMARLGLENGDAAAIRAVADPDSPDRHHVLRNWLEDYGVFQGLTNSLRDQVTEEVLGFMDSHEVDQELDIVERVIQLEEHCYNLTHRRLTSLASKALWCQFPDRVPLLDGNAERALWMLSRLCEIRRPPARDHRYRRFMVVWHAIYKKAEPLICERNRGNYDHSLRIFDKMLWLLGRSDYGTYRLA